MFLNACLLSLVCCQHSPLLEDCGSKRDFIALRTRFGEMLRIIKIYEARYMVSRPELPKNKSHELVISVLFQ